MWIGKRSAIVQIENSTMKTRDNFFILFRGALRE